MSDRYTQKDHGVADAAREVSGIYKLGFEKESMAGFLLPGTIVIGVGGVLGFIIWQLL